MACMPDEQKRLTVTPLVVTGKPARNGAASPSLYCAVIVKRVDAQTRAKTSINDLLRSAE